MSAYKTKTTLTRGDEDPETGLVFWAINGRDEVWISPSELKARKLVVNENMRNWRRGNRERNRQNKARSRRKNITKARASVRAWKKKNPEKAAELRRRYTAKRRANSVIYRLQNAMRCRIHYALNSKWKTKRRRTWGIVGCSGEFLRDHLAAQFKPGMSWKNYGDEWQIDHRIPVSLGKTRSEIEALCHYLNLQPLWKEENRIKSNKFNAA